MIDACELDDMGQVISQRLLPYPTYSLEPSQPDLRHSFSLQPKVTVDLLVQDRTVRCPYIRRPGDSMGTPYKAGRDVILYKVSRETCSSRAIPPYRRTQSLRSLRLSWSY